MLHCCCSCVSRLTPHEELWTETELFLREEETWLVTSV